MLMCYALSYACACFYVLLMFYVFVVSQRVKMRGTRRSARLTGVPPVSEGTAARPPALPRARSHRSSREGTSRDPRRSSDESRRGVSRGGRSVEERGVMEEDQSRDVSMGVGRSEEGMGES